MARIEEEFITSAEQEERFSQWYGDAENLGVHPPEDPLFNEWKNIIPRSNYGEISITKVPPSFLKGFKEALRYGYVNDFIHDRTEGGYDGIYISTTQDLESESDRKIREQHSPEFLDGIVKRLRDFEEQVDSSEIPDSYKEEYKKSISGSLQFTKAARGVSTPDFTVEYNTPNGWSELIDVDASLAQGTVILKYEDEAREVLRRSRERINQSPKDVPVKKALEFWNLSDTEKEKIGFEEIDDSSEFLSPEQTATLFEIVLDRVGLIERGWNVILDESAAGVSVAAKTKEVKVPSDRRLKGWDVRNIPGHETVHAVRGENGEKQGLKLLGEGVSDYLKTEEGTGAVAEMVLGEEFGDDRQVKFAARYLAVAMAMKAHEVSGEIMPQYSIQEIHDNLRENGVNVTDAEDIVWRIFRGTSLKHKGLKLPVMTSDGIKEISSAECYPKDTVYFEGQMEVFNWIKENLPFAEGQERSETVDSLDFSRQFLIRLGRAVEIMSDIQVGDNHELVDDERYLKEGRLMLMDLLRKLCKGKMRIDFLNRNSGWSNQFVNEGLVDYAKILNPST